MFDVLFVFVMDVQIIVWCCYSHSQRGDNGNHPQTNWPPVDYSKHTNISNPGWMKTDITLPNICVSNRTRHSLRQCYPTSSLPLILCDAPGMCVLKISVKMLLKLEGSFARCRLRRHRPGMLANHINLTAFYIKYFSYLFQH